MSEKKALLFDLDGVLVDVSSSFRQAVRLTVQHFSGKIIPASLIERYKNRGGMNNDWDLTTRLLLDLGVVVERGEVVKRFQELYRGADFDGLISGERWLIRDDVLDRAVSEFPLGIVTGRPREEALFTIGRSGTGGRFSSIIAMEDVPPLCGKPNPLGIKLALKSLDAGKGWYAGDNPDDVRAALGAGLTPIGVVPGTGGPAPSPDSETALREAGASTIIHDINDILEVLK